MAAPGCLTDEAGESEFSAHFGDFQAEIRTSDRRIDSANEMKRRLGAAIILSVGLTGPLHSPDPNNSYSKRTGPAPSNQFRNSDVS
jgi:hypothetical protein